MLFRFAKWQVNNEEYFCVFKASKREALKTQKYSSLFTCLFSLKVLRGFQVVSVSPLFNALNNESKHEDNPKTSQHNEEYYYRGN